MFLNEKNFNVTKFVNKLGAVLIVNKNRDDCILWCSKYLNFAMVNRNGEHNLVSIPSIPVFNKNFINTPSSIMRECYLRLIHHKII